ncbi:hypothetical protein ACVRYP_00340 [Streptococcus rifensis]
MGKQAPKTRPVEPSTPQVSPELQLLIEEAYTLFACELQRPLDLCTCPVCISEDNLERLETEDVHQISKELMFEYLDAVRNEDGDDQIRHFLPRILELIARYDYIRIDDSLNLDRCHFEKKGWSSEELDFMGRFSRQFIIDTINLSSTRADAIAVYLTMFDLAGLETSHLLDLKLWLEDTDQMSSLWALEEIYYYFTKDYACFDYSFSVNPSFNKQMTDWLSSQALAQGFLPVLEAYLLSDSPLTSEEEYRLEQLYRVFEGQINS